MDTLLSPNSLFIAGLALGLSQTVSLVIQNSLRKKETFGTPAYVRITGHIKAKVIWIILGVVLVIISFL